MRVYGGRVGNGIRGLTCVWTFKTRVSTEVSSKFQRALHPLADVLSSSLHFTQSDQFHFLSFLALVSIIWQWKYFFLINC